MTDKTNQRQTDADSATTIDTLCDEVYRLDDEAWLPDSFPAWGLTFCQVVADSALQLHTVEAVGVRTKESEPQVMIERQTPSFGNKMGKWFTDHGFEMVGFSVWNGKDWSGLTTTTFVVHDPSRPEQMQVISGELSRRNRYKQVGLDFGNNR